MSWGGIPEGHAFINNKIKNFLSAISSFLYLFSVLCYEDCMKCRKLLKKCYLTDSVIHMQFQSDLIHSASGVPRSG